MKLPNPEHAHIDPGKLGGYCLSPTHEDGQHKARVFQGALGLRAEDERELREALLQAVRTDEATPGITDRHGSTFVVDFVMTRAGRSAGVRSVWIVRRSEDFPRLVTCYIRT